MAWPIARRVASLIPAVPTRRYAIAGSIVLLGVVLTSVVWFRAESERQLEIVSMLATNADRSTDQLEWAMHREVDGLHKFSDLWRVHDPDSSLTWPVEAGILLEHFPAIRWVAWLTADTAVLAFVGRDSTASIDPELLWHARLQLTSTASETRERWTDAYEFNTILPVRTDDGGLGALIAEFRFDSVWVSRERTLVGIRTARLVGAEGQTVLLKSQPDSLAPPWMRMSRTLTSPTGSTLTAEWIPSDAFVKQVLTSWPALFVFAGGLFSLALGALLISFLRQRDLSVALGGSVQELDRRLEEISVRERELREVNEALNDRVQERTVALTRALRELETLNHSVSHDLRSPIGAIMNFTAVLEEDVGPRLEPEQRRFLERIRSAAGRANQLLDALSEYMSSNAPALRMRTLDMSSLVRGALAEAQGREPGGTRGEFDIAPLPPALGDPDLVHRVLVNLLGNALKYSRDRDPRRVSVSGREEAGEAVFNIHDNGRGFDPARAVDLFQPFHRLHDIDVEGSGLGLAIVSRLVSGMGGRVWADSDGATMAVFSFTLPRAQGRESDGTNDTSRG